MRQDQFEKLQALEEKLVDVFLDEANPDGWSKDKKERYWQRREAAETAALLVRTQALMSNDTGGRRQDPDREKEAERMIEQASNRAAKAVERAIARAKNRAQQG